MKLLLALTLMVCVSGALADGPLPKINLPESITKNIPALFLKPLDLLNDSIDKLNGLLDMSKWTDLLSSSGEAGKAVLTSLKSFIALFVNGDYTSPFAIADVANDSYKALGKVQDAIKKVNDIPLYIPGLSSLDGALGNMKGNLALVRCIRPANCISWPFGRRRSIKDEDFLEEFKIHEEE